eukprot:s4606_g8.t1
MVVSFFFVFLSTVPVIAQMGCLYCFGVALDVYIVRLWLAPAALCIFEQANYWPGKVPDPTKCYVPDNGLPLKAQWEEQKQTTPSVKHIVTVGEPLGCALANRVMQTRGLEAQLHNFYGASESSCTVYTVPKTGVDLQVFPSKAPCGRPQPHSAVYVMREEGDPAVLVQVANGEVSGLLREASGCS